MVLSPTLGWSADDTKLKTLTVCEILADLEAFNGKEVAIRGEWISGGHGKWLSSPGGECDPQLVTKGFVWDNVIHLVQDDEGKVDRDSTRRFGQKLRAEVRVRPWEAYTERHTITATFVGTLEARAPPIVAYMMDGTLGGYGFGHMNTAPAELLWKAVLDVEIQKRAGEYEFDAPPGLPLAPQFGTTGHITALEVNEVDAEAGHRSEFGGDTEVTVRLDALPRRTIGFTLRRDINYYAHQAMIQLLTFAFANKRRVSIDYILQPGGRSGTIYDLSIVDFSSEGSVEPVDAQKSDPPGTQTARGNIRVVSVTSVGVGFGPRDDYLDGEVMITLHQYRRKKFGFTLRDDKNAVAHMAMFNLLFEAFTHQWVVSLEYDSPPTKERVAIVSVRVEEEN